MFNNYEANVMCEQRAGSNKCYHKNMSSEKVKFISFRSYSCFSLQVLDPAVGFALFVLELLRSLAQKGKSKPHRLWAFHYNQGYCEQIVST